MLQEVSTVNNHIDMASNTVPTVTVVTLTYNRREKILALLRALERQNYASFEVIIVDNASSDGTVEAVHAQFPQVHLIQSPMNRRNYSYNLGLEMARGKYVVMIDDDGLPAGDEWITKIVNCFENNRRLAVVACAIRMHDTDKLAGDSPQYVPVSNGKNGFPTPAYNGTGVGLRTKAIKPLLPIYPREFFHTYIELHLCTRLIDSGWEVRFFPEIEVWHCRPTRKVDPPLQYYGLRNYYYYIWTLYPWRQALYESAHEFGSRLMLATTGKIQPRLFLSALKDALAVDIPEALRSRRPVSTGTIAYLREIRRAASTIS